MLYGFESAAKKQKRKIVEKILFKDTEDDDSSCHYLVVVVDVVFERKSKTLCFSFRNTKMTLRASLEYIVVDYAINECEWLDLEKEPIVYK